MGTRIRSGLAAVSIIAAYLLIGTAFVAAPASASEPGVKRVDIAFTGSTQEVIVPANVTAATIVLAGGAGGNNTVNLWTGTGGTGALVQATVPVLPGEVLKVAIGGSGGSVNASSSPASGGWAGDLAWEGGHGGNPNGHCNAGSGGGGASAVWIADEIVILASGGGGAGGTCGAYFSGGSGDFVTGHAGEKYSGNTGSEGGGPSAPNLSKNGGSASGGVQAAGGGGGGGGGEFVGAGGTKSVHGGGGGGGGSSLIASRASELTHGQAPSGAGFASITWGGALPQISGAPQVGIVGNGYSFGYQVGLADAVTVAAGELPEGLTLGEDGAISGTPTAAGTYSFTARAINLAGWTDIASILTVVQSASIDGVPPAATVGTPYEYDFAVVGDPTPVVRVKDGTSVPPGLVLDARGRLTGTPTTSGSFDFTVVADNGIGGPSAVDVVLAVADDAVEVTVPPLTQPTASSDNPVPVAPSAGAARLAATGSNVSIAGAVSVALVSIAVGCLVMWARRHRLHKN